MFIEKVILWGAGTIGSRFINHLRDVEVIAYIDSDVKKVGTLWMNKPIISFEEYREKYSDIYIIISGYYFEEIIEKLKRNDCYRFFWCMDCPGEWTDLDLRIEFEELIYKKVQLARKPVVYGCNYYGMTLIKRIYEATGIISSLAYNSYADKQLIDSLKNDFPEIKISTIDNLEYSEVFVAEDRRYGFVEENIGDDAEIIECWDCSFEIESYFNRSLKKYKNIHEGERCFIIGLGPSLTTKDLDILNRNCEICFSMNEIFKLYDKTKWRPDYFVVSDTQGIIDEKESYAGLINCDMFVSDQLGDEYVWYFVNKCGERFNWYHIHRATSIQLPPLFSNDFEKTAYYGYTVTYIIIQLAVYMGFKKIYLLGVDATGASRGYGKVKYGHFYDKEDINAGRLFEPYNTNAYRSARSAARKRGVDIYNATRGGELEVFTRVDFDSLFDE